MKIVLDARWIGAAPSGIGVYANELIRRLPAIEPDWQFHLLFDDDVLSDRVLSQSGLADNEHVTAETLPYGIFSIEGQIRLPHLFTREFQRAAIDDLADRLSGQII